MHIYFAPLEGITTYPYRNLHHKYFGGVVTSTGVTGEVDADLKAVVTETRDRIVEKMAKLRVADAISEVFALFRRCNKYIDETTPWVLAKDEAQKDRLAEVLYNLTESITIGASLLHPFLPETAESTKTGIQENCYRLRR